MITVSYKTLVNKLEKDLSISLTTAENPTKVKRKLSMAKHREGIDGKLIFSHTSYMKEGKEVFVITAVLAPKKNELNILALNGTESF